MSVARGGYDRAVNDPPSDEPESRRPGVDEGSAGDRADGRRFARLRALDRNVTALGIVSLVADLSSEMVYPLIPLFVTSVLGAPVAVLGLIEGVAEATASLTRYPFGRASDSLHRRRAFVFSGYGMSALGKLILALAYVWPVALAGRFVDRVGKGVRTAPRDALLAAGVPEKDRGLAFGLHRTLDTLGAVLGPLAALLLIDLGLSIRAVLAVAVLPGIASVVVIALFVRERAPGGARSRTPPPASARLAGVPLDAGRVARLRRRQLEQHVHPAARQVARLRRHGRDPALRALQRHLRRRLTAARRPLRPRRPVPRGDRRVPRLRRRVRRLRPVHAAAGRSPCSSPSTASTSPPRRARRKALLSRSAPDAERGSAMGLYDTLVGVAGFAASALGGVLWSAVGPWATFVYGAACALAAAAVLLMTARSPDRGPYGKGAQGRLEGQTPRIYHGDGDTVTSRMATMVSARISHAPSPGPARGALRRVASSLPRLDERADLPHLRPARPPASGPSREPVIGHRPRASVPASSATASPGRRRSDHPSLDGRSCVAVARPIRRPWSSIPS